MFVVRLGWTLQRLTWTNTGRSLKRVPSRAVTRTFRSCRISWSKSKMHWRVNDDKWWSDQCNTLKTRACDSNKFMQQSSFRISDYDTIWIICIFRLLNQNTSFPINWTLDHTETITIKSEVRWYNIYHSQITYVHEQLVEIGSFLRVKLPTGPRNFIDPSDLWK